jgi:hypothetical protein
VSLTREGLGLLKRGERRRLEQAVQAQQRTVARWERELEQPKASWRRCGPPAGTPTSGSSGRRGGGTLSAPVAVDLPRFSGQVTPHPRGLDQRPAQVLGSGPPIARLAPPSSSATRRSSTTSARSTASSDCAHAPKSPGNRHRGRSSGPGESPRQRRHTGAEDRRGAPSLTTPSAPGGEPRGLIGVSPTRNSATGRNHRSVTQHRPRAGRSAHG